MVSAFVSSLRSVSVGGLPTLGSASEEQFLGDGGTKLVSHVSCHGSNMVSQHIYEFVMKNLTRFQREPDLQAAYHVIINIVGHHVEYALRLKLNNGVPDTLSRICVGLDSGQSINRIPISRPQSRTVGDTDPFPCRVGEEEGVIIDVRQPVGLTLA